MWFSVLDGEAELEGIACSFIGIQVLISFPTFFPFFAGLVSKADQAEWGWPKWLSLPSALKWLGYGRRKGCHKEVIYFLQLQRSVGVHVSSSTTSWAAQPSPWVVQCVQSCGSHSKHTWMSGSIAEGHHHGHFYGQYNYKMNLHVETLIRSILVCCRNVRSMYMLRMRDWYRSIARRNRNLFIISAPPIP